MNRQRSSQELMIFAKAPAPGRVKTRLAAAITAQRATELYECMVLDTLAMTAEIPGVVRTVFCQDDPGATEYFAAVAPGIETVIQEGDDLGARMRNAFARMFDRGACSAVVIGSDAPHLPPEYISLAFNLLSERAVDVVIGPSMDGGYYLLGMKRVWHGLFEGIPWSSDAVLEATIRAADRMRCRIESLPPWCDIDTGEDLFRQELLDSGNAAVRTRMFITSVLQPDSQPPGGGRPRR